jgi:ATP-dependent Clp protease adaptor protein ClpS
MAETIQQPEKTTAKPTPDAAKPKTLPPWNVVLLDDDHHTYDYVIEMLINLFGHSLERAFKLARGVDRDGRAVIFTTHRELAELKREQILDFGEDPRISHCPGPMSAMIEPAAE